RERDRLSQAFASTRSSRGEPSSPATVTLILSPPFEEVSCKEDPMTEAAIPEPTPEQAQLFARVRRMMLIAGATTGIAVAAVLFAVGYRLFKSEGSVTTAHTDTR